MKCLKCGIEIPEDEVFCMECLLDAQRYPVEPGAAVYLPKRQAAEVPKKAPRRRVITSEEQVAILRRRLRVLAAAAAVLALIVGGLTLFLIDSYSKPRLKTGQNYSAVVQTTASPSGTTP